MMGVVEKIPTLCHVAQPKADGHDTGLYSWDYLYMLGQQQDSLWQQYLDRLAEAGASRDPALTPPPAPKHGCGHKH